MYACLRFAALYSELNLNQYSVGSPCRTICTVCGSPPCPDLNLIHYIVNEVGRQGRAFLDGIVLRNEKRQSVHAIKLLKPSENLFSGFQTALCF
ncbi:hypothetical protein NEIELOOT_01405 [Neisseria elongata subsp. glycolytica ATCC 29315]|uniref:Uncharacterized protein n=1 Tax=Neisseria elongata subsp. glycolytica ATCC 29315 TaxID=546263 RepID=D4DQR5_NEIEG|nr:hypothetical protein NEIELOOT_01405 [Neisseria elongata subsp. glycolytica ATCC 29315]